MRSAIGRAAVGVQRVAGAGGAADVDAIATPLIAQRCVPVAATEKPAPAGSVTVTFAGCVVMLGGTGAALTVSVAIALVTVPDGVRDDHVNCEPLSLTAVGFSE